jgi:hypothetical protein
MKTNRPPNNFRVSFLTFIYFSAAAAYPLLFPP